MTAEEFLDPAVAPALHVIRRPREGRIRDEPEQVWNCVAQERPGAAQSSVRVPPMSARTIGPVFQEPVVLPAPTPECADPSPLLPSRPDAREVMHEREEFPPRPCLRILREPGARLPHDVDEATLQERVRPDLADGLQEAALGIADDHGGHQPFMPQRKKEREPCAV